MQNELANYQRAYRTLKAKEAKTGFKINLSAYIIVNSILTAINVLLVPVFPWCIFPLIGWGIGVTMHYTFGVRYIGRELAREEAKIEQIAKKL